MHAIRRRLAAFTLGSSVALGLALAAAPADVAEAAPSIEICNSGASVSTIKVYSSPYFINVGVGQCGNFLDTTSLRVSFPGCTYWEVRTRGPGGYGQNYSCSLNSNPGHESSYIYKTS